MSSTISKTETVQGETWREMAARLGVEVTEMGNVTFRKGPSSDFFKVSCYLTLRGSSVPCIDTMSNIHLNPPSIPQKARDLSDCLQVAARYLEEVHG